MFSDFSMSLKDPRKRSHSYARNDDIYRSSQTSSRSYGYERKYSSRSRSHSTNNKPERENKWEGIKTLMYNYAHYGTAYSNNILDDKHLLNSRVCKDMANQFDRETTLSFAERQLLRDQQKLANRKNKREGYLKMGMIDREDEQNKNSNTNSIKKLTDKDSEFDLIDLYLKQFDMNARLVHYDMGKTSIHRSKKKKEYELTVKEEAQKRFEQKKFFNRFKDVKHPNEIRYVSNHKLQTPEDVWDKFKQIHKKYIKNRDNQRKKRNPSFYYSDSDSDCEIKEKRKDIFFRKKKLKRNKIIRRERLLAGLPIYGTVMFHNGPRKEYETEKINMFYLTKICHVNSMKAMDLHLKWKQEIKKDLRRMNCKRFTRAPANKSQLHCSRPERRKAIAKLRLSRMKNEKKAFAEMVDKKKKLLKEKRSDVKERKEKKFGSWSEVTGKNGPKRPFSIKKMAKECVTRFLYGPRKKIKQIRKKRKFMKYHKTANLMTDLDGRSLWPEKFNSRLQMSYLLAASELDSFEKFSQEKDLSKIVEEFNKEIAVGSIDQTKTLTRRETKQIFKRYKSKKSSGRLPSIQVMNGMDYFEGKLLDRTKFADHNQNQISENCSEKTPAIRKKLIKQLQMREYLKELKTNNLSAIYSSSKIPMLPLTSKKMLPRCKTLDSDFYEKIPKHDSFDFAYPFIYSNHSVFSDCWRNRSDQRRDRILNNYNESCYLDELKKLRNNYPNLERYLTNWTESGNSVSFEAESLYKKYCNRLNLTDLLSCAPADSKVSTTSTRLTPAEINQYKILTKLKRCGYFEDRKSYLEIKDNKFGTLSEFYEKTSGKISKFSKIDQNYNKIFQYHLNYQAKINIISKLWRLVPNKMNLRSLGNVITEKVKIKPESKVSSHFSNANKNTLVIPVKVKLYDDHLIQQNIKIFENLVLNGGSSISIFLGLDFNKNREFLTDLIPRSRIEPVKRLKTKPRRTTIKESSQINQFSRNFYRWKQGKKSLAILNNTTKTIKDPTLQENRLRNVVDGRDTDFIVKVKDLPVFDNMYDNFQGSFLKNLVPRYFLTQAEIVYYFLFSNSLKNADLRQLKMMLNCLTKASGKKIASIAKEMKTPGGSVFERLSGGRPSGIKIFIRDIYSQELPPNSLGFLENSPYPRFDGQNDLISRSAGINNVLLANIRSNFYKHLTKYVKKLKFTNNPGKINKKYLNQLIGTKSFIEYDRNWKYYLKRKNLLKSYNQMDDISDIDSNSSKTILKSASNPSNMVLKLWELHGFRQVFRRYLRKNTFRGKVRHEAYVDDLLRGIP